MERRRTASTSAPHLPPIAQSAAICAIQFMPERLRATMTPDTGSIQLPSAPGSSYTRPCPPTNGCGPPGAGFARHFTSIHRIHMPIARTTTHFYPSNSHANCEDSPRRRAAREQPPPARVERRTKRFMRRCAARLARASTAEATPFRQGRRTNA